MLEAPCKHLKENPTLYQDEIAVFLWDEFGKHVTIQSITYPFKSIFPLHFFGSHAKYMYHLHSI